FIRRFQKRIYVPLPDVKARMDMFQIYSQNLKFQNNVDFAELARRTEGYSGGDIRDLFQSTQIKVVRDFFQRGAANDLNAIPNSPSLPTVSPTESPAWKTRTSSASTQRSSTSQSSASQNRSS